MDAERLFEENYDDLFRYLMRLTGDSDRASDAAQEAFVRLVEHEPTGDQLRGWLFRVATNLIRDESRVRRRRRELLEEVGDRVPVADPPTAPDRQFEVSQQKAMVRQALGRLNTKERTVLLMREEGFSHQEIAEAVGTTTKSVGSMIARALKKLSVEVGPNTENLG